MSVSKRAAKGRALAADMRRQLAGPVRQRRGDLVDRMNRLEAGIEKLRKRVAKSSKAAR